MNMPLRFGLSGSLALLVGGLAGAACADPDPGLQSRPAQFRLTHESVAIDDHEHMGLTGVSYLVNVLPALYLGASAYGSTHGARGGFFTGGATLGTGVRRGRATLDTGLFVGGGGGAGAPQGGGLMYRPHLGVTYDLGGVTWGAGASWVKFPNGDIDSRQIYLGAAVPFELLYTGGTRNAWAPLGDATGWIDRRGQMKATWGRYRPTASAHTRDGQPQPGFQTLGFAYERALDRGWFAALEAAGAGSGHSDGYAEVLAGVGWQLPLTSLGTQARVSLAAGAAGGGNVDTGGGGLARARLALHQDLGPRLGVDLSVARLVSAGSFAANQAGVALTYRFAELARGSSSDTGNGSGNDSAHEAYLQPWDAGFSHQTYRRAQRKNGPGEDIDLVGIKLSRLLNDYTYLTGQAYGAYDGNAGGYAVGLIGAGLGIPLGDRWRTSLELLAGVSGGGGVDVAGGALRQAQVGLAYRLSPSSRLQIEAGRVQSFSGRLDADVINLNWVYRYNKPELRL